MEFRILGPLEVRGEFGAVALGGIKPRAVLAVLLLHANEPVSAERLAVALWGENAPRGAVKTAQVHVARLRKALADPDAVATTPAGYRLRVRPGELDAERFARGVAQGRRALEAGDVERAAALLREALELWRGPALAELAFEPFAQTAIARLEEQRLDALEARVEADLAAGRHAELVSELQQLLAEHPTREGLAARLMLALYRSGRQAEALEVYRDGRLTLVEELGIEPGPELHDLHEAMLAHDPGLAPPSGAASRASGRRSALPAAPNRTIGRGDEVRAVVERLRSGSVRLLTLTGPGGVGKTRLALEAARAVEADFAHGACLVSLAAVARPEDVAPAIVGALEIVPLAGESLEQAIERFLAAKHLLLVVDNCEHLPGAAPFIGGLAAACPAVTVLATSREPLVVHAEQLHPVSPLALPAPGRHVDPEALTGVDSVTLFCERARAHDPGFEVSDGAAAAVAEICRRVDGLPLAIELAAARCGLLSPREVADRLGDALGGLGAAPRDAPARQQTLRATIDWSHALLDEDEKACFARFAVFAGGATIDAAEAITGASIDTLDRLVAKSLLVRRRQPDGSTRLGMLETIREYAGERFAAVADRDAVRERHYRYYLEVARRHGALPAILGPGRKEHLRRLDRERENVDAALDWAIDQGTALPALELSAALDEYWMARNRYADAVAYIERALSKPGADGAPELRIRALLRKGWAMWPLGRRAEQPAVVAEAEATARALADPAILADVLYQRAALESHTRRVDVGSALADEALICAKTAGDPWTVAMAAWARVVASGSSELRERVEQAAPLLQSAGNAYHLATLFETAAYRALCNGSDGDACDFTARAVPLARALDDRFLWMKLQRKVGLAALFTGDTEAARDAFREALGVCRELVVLPAASEGLCGLAAVAAVGDELDRAARLVGAAARHRYAEPEGPIDARLHATFLAPACARCGADAWDAAVRDGAASSFEDAIAYALDEPGAPARPLEPIRAP